MTPLQPVANHLLQCTAFALAASLLALALRQQPARVRYWLWSAASLKFLLPFSALFALGSRLDWASEPAGMREAVSSAVEEFGAPFAAAAAPRLPASAYATVSIASVLLTVWAAGCAVVLICWLIRWKRLATIIHVARFPVSGPEAEALQRVQAQFALASPGATQAARLALTDVSVEPGVFGIFRPVLLLPAGIAERLSSEQLETIMTHELCHVRRRDNLAAAVHLVAEAIFWFHPLIWWLGTRLVEERERACDEEVLRRGASPRVYAGAILRACEFCLQSHGLVGSGISGGGVLNKRIQQIMRLRFVHRLGAGTKVFFAAAALAAVSIPVFMGVAGAPVARAQSPSGVEKFDVVSIRPYPPGVRGWGFVTDPGRMRMVNVTLKDCIMAAFGIQGFQLEGQSLPSDRYEIIGAAPSHPSRVLDARYQTMMQAMLADRFALKVHRDTKVLPVYAMELAKHGPKLTVSDAPGLSTKSTPGHVIVTGATMLEFVTYLTRRVGRPVVDLTGLKGLYDFTLDWTPNESEASLEPPPNPDKPGQLDASGPSLFTALQEQLGLKLTSKKLPVETIVVDHAEKPSVN